MQIAAALAAWASLWVIGIVPASASELAAADAASPGSCELHIWTTNNLNAVFHGLRLRTGAQLMDVTPQEAAAEAMRRLLNPETQKVIISAQVPTSDSPFVAYRLIVHEAPERSKFANWLNKHVGDGPRETRSNSQCYAELHLVGLTVFETALHKQLQTIYVFRQFGSSPVALWTVRDAASTNPDDFKTSKVEQTDEGATALREAFGRGIARILAWKKLGRT